MAVDESPLESLIARAQHAAEGMGRKNHTRVLLKDMAVALVAQARLIADLTNKAVDRSGVVTVASVWDPATQPIQPGADMRVGGSRIIVS